jgi:mannose/fructose/N-acetylgalactosamine-specific phosphotransferase system component IID
MTEFLFGLNQIIIMVITLAMLYLSTEIGYRYGLRFTERTSEKVLSHVSTIEASLLGLMALLLGFAFSMAMSRYDIRKQVVLDEVNDLQTTFMRTQLLPKEYRGPCAELLKQYVDTRITYFQAGTDKDLMKNSLSQTKAVQAKLWNTAVQAARANDSEVVTGYFVATLNDLIDDHTRRVTAMENHVPQTILGLLFLVCCMTMAVTGYSSGLRTKRLKALRVILITLIAATLIVIVDLDRPRRGLITISEAGMLQLKQDLAQFVVDSPRG